MKPIFVRNSHSTSNQTMSHDHQKHQHRVRNRRRQQQRRRRKYQGNLFHLQQHTYPAFHNQNHFLWGYDRMRQQIAKPITVVAGSSMVSRLIERNLQTFKDTVKLTFESGCNCEKMLSWLSSIEGHQFMCGVGRLILILGTNDLHVVGAKETVQRIRVTVESIRLLFPGIQVVWQLLQWRTRPTCYIASGAIVLKEIDKCNMMLLELAQRLQFQVIDPALGRHHICHDNLHPNIHGSRLIENCIRSFLEKH